MNTSQARLVTIFAEAILQDRLRDQLSEWGVSEYSITEVTSRMIRPNNSAAKEKPLIRVEVVVSPEIADSVLLGIQTAYLEAGAVTCYVSDVIAYQPGFSHPQESNRMTREQVWGDYLITI